LDLRPPTGSGVSGGRGQALAAHSPYGTSRSAGRVWVRCSIRPTAICTTRTALDPNLGRRLGRAVHRGLGANLNRARPAWLGTAGPLGIVLVGVMPISCRAGWASFDGPASEGRARLRCLTIMVVPRRSCTKRSKAGRRQRSLRTSGEMPIQRARKCSQVAENTAFVR
jgi:hypothetical protein